MNQLVDITDILSFDDPNFDFESIDGENQVKQLETHFCLSQDYKI
jgi:hypothetical protein